MPRASGTVSGESWWTRTEELLAAVPSRRRIPVRLGVELLQASNLVLIAHG